jgi:hypothetical protein
MNARSPVSPTGGGILLCLLLAFLFFADGWFGERTLLPTGDLYASEPWRSDPSAPSPDPGGQFDQTYQFYPWARFFRESVARGTFPLWNPYNYLGTPFFANPQTALLFPLNWSHLVLPLRYSFTLLFTVKLALALVGMFLWLRRLRLSPEASLAGAAIFGLSMHTIVSLAFPYGTVTVLLPWLLLSVVRLAEGVDRLRWSAAAGMATLTVLAGQPQSALVALLAAAAFAAAALIRLPGDRLRRALGLASAGLAALVLTAVQWLSSFEYLSESMVSHGPRIIKSGYPYSPSCFLNLVIPDFFGSHLDGGFWGFPGYHDMAFYASILALLLAPLAVGLRSRTDRYLPATLVSGALALGVILGLPLWENLLDLPGFDLIRRSRMVPLLVFCLAELAARGLDAAAGLGLRGRLVRLLPAAAATLGLGLAGLIWFGPFLAELDPDRNVAWNLLRATALVLAGGGLLLAGGRWTSRGILVLLLIDLAPLSHPLNPRGSASWLYREPALAAELEGSPPRIFSTGQVFVPNSAMAAGLQDVRGYDVMTPERLFRYMQRIDPTLGNAYRWLMNIDPDRIGPETRLRRTIGRWVEAHGEELRAYMERDSYWSVGATRIDDPALFRRLRIDYFLSTGGTAPSGYEETDSAHSTIRVYRSDHAARARLFSDWVAVDGADAALDAVATLDPESAVVVEAALPSADTAEDAGSLPEPILLSWGAERVEYAVSGLNRPALLVVYDRYSSGWKAFLEGGGEPEVFRADSIFRGVHLPAGDHRVTFVYKPRGFRVGLVVSLAGLLFLVAGFVVARGGVRSKESGVRSQE